ncbi:hypothetical protein [uncultured Sphingomonas sp.]|uniref:hypothetical protein n=1 Tax=uncultured Sphingomonas sp. TaxID=158754 RepID=UPI0035CA662D
MAAALAAPVRRARSAPQDGGLRGRALAALHAAVARAVESASDETLEAIIGAAGDPAQALAVAPRDLAPVPPERLVAERAAKARTVHFRAELTAKAGGMLARSDVADLLGVGSAAVDKQRQRGQILSVPYGTDIRFPAAQFRDGRAVPGLKPILAAFGDMNSWGQLQLLVAPLEGFSDEPASILDLLAAGVDAETLDELAGLARGWAA